MSDETYYTVLNVKETASASEIKNAYRDLIKQVHPDTIATLAPYLRRIAEDKAREIIEAYTVLSNSSKRRDYDRQLAAYRCQSAPQAAAPPTPPPRARRTASQSSSGPYCSRCGTSLYATGFCPRCSKFSAASAPQPQVVRQFGYNWAPLIRWAREYPLLAFVVIPVLLVCIIGTALSNNDKPSTSTVASAPTTPSKTASTVTGNPENQHVVVGDDAIEKAKTANGSSVIDLRKKSVIDLRNNSNSNATRDAKMEPGVTPGLDKLARDLPRNWLFVCSPDDANCKWNSPPFQVWIEGNDVHESQLTSSGGGAEEIECVSHPNGSGWLGSCFYTLTWTNPSRSCRVQTSEQITKITPSVIVGVSQRVDNTPLKDGKCPVPGVDSLAFTLIPQPPRLTRESE